MTTQLQLINIIIIIIIMYYNAAITPYFLRHSYIFRLKSVFNTQRVPGFPPRSRTEPRQLARTGGKKGKACLSRIEDPRITGYVIFYAASTPTVSRS